VKQETSTERSFSMNAYMTGNRRPIARQAMAAPIPTGLLQAGAVAGIAGGAAMLSTAALLAAIKGYDIWFQLKAIGALALGPGALAQSGFVAGPVLAGLAIHLVVAALLGALFIFVTRSVLRLPSDYGMPAVTGLMLGMLVWLAAYVAVPTMAPFLMAIAAPAFIIQHIVFGTVAGMVASALRPQPYATSY
jgi:hypothetical protein